MVSVLGIISIDSPVDQVVSWLKQDKMGGAEVPARALPWKFIIVETNKRMNKREIISGFSETQKQSLKKNLNCPKLFSSTLEKMDISNSIKKVKNFEIIIEFSIT